MSFGKYILRFTLIVLGRSGRTKRSENENATKIMGERYVGRKIKEETRLDREVIRILPPNDSSRSGW